MFFRKTQSRILTHPLHFTFSKYNAQDDNIYLAVPGQSRRKGQPAYFEDNSICIYEQSSCVTVRGVPYRPWCYRPQADEERGVGGWSLSEAPPPPLYRGSRCVEPTPVYIRDYFMEPSVQGDGVLNRTREHCRPLYGVPLCGDPPVDRHP